MGWPRRLRVQSFAITLGLTAFEAVVYSVPLGFVLWLVGLGDVRRIAIALAALAGLWSLGIALGSHLWTRVMGNANGNGKGNHR
jgi:hypothetical protein